MVVLLEIATFPVSLHPPELISENFVSGLEIEEDGIGHQLVLEQFEVPVVFLFGLVQLGLHQVFAGDRGFIVGFGRIATGLVVVRLDLDEQIALLHMVAFLDRQRHDFTGDFGTDHHLDNRLDLAVCHHNFGDVAAADLFGLNGDDGFLLPENGHQRQEDEDNADDGEDENFLAFFGICHVA